MSEQKEDAGQDVQKEVEALRRQVLELMENSMDGLREALQRVDALEGKAADLDWDLSNTKERVDMAEECIDRLSYE